MFSALILNSSILFFKFHLNIKKTKEIGKLNLLKKMKTGLSYANLEED